MGDAKGWRYSINYGPDGEDYYANVYDGDGELVGNLKTHHAAAVVAACNALTALRARAEKAEAALGAIESNLAFYEDSGECWAPNGHQVIWINVADFNEMLRIAREVIAAETALTALTSRATSAEAALEKMRAEAIEECAVVADKFFDVHGMETERQRFNRYDVARFAKTAVGLVAEDIRALAALPPKPEAL